MLSYLQFIANCMNFIYKDIIKILASLNKKLLKDLKMLLIMELFGYHPLNICNVHCKPWKH